MNSVIYNPLQEYLDKFRQAHLDNADRFLQQLVEKSGVDVEANRKTVAEYNTLKDDLASLKRKYNLYRVLRVLMIITLILIPLVIMKMTPKIRELREQISSADRKISELLALAQRQMQPLNSLFTSRDALKIIEETVPLMKFADNFTARQEVDMSTNYDFRDVNGNEQSTLDVLAGEYNENPFLFENKRIHTMGSQVYHGYLTISWTETERDSDGNTYTVTRTQTLHAQVTRPKPFYSSQVVLNYGSQSGPELSFSRDATHLERKSDRAIDRYVKRGERKLKRMTDKAIKNNDDFVSMSNSDFEVLFDALDRTNEVQFRALFTPLAQTNMVEIIRSKEGYGDDFNFFKNNRMNRIVAHHSQGRVIRLVAADYYSYSYDIIRENFLGKNQRFFKDVYFDFAPLLAIPSYQERPVHSLKPIPNFERRYSQKECEAVANGLHTSYVVHPKTKTPAILKSQYLASDKGADRICVTAYSYDIIPRITYVPMWGGDGQIHQVPVPWDDYIPLQAKNEFYVADAENTAGINVIGIKDGISIYR